MTDSLVARESEAEKAGFESRRNDAVKARDGGAGQRGAGAQEEAAGRGTDTFWQLRLSARDRARRWGAVP